MGQGLHWYFSAWTVKINYCEVPLSCPNFYSKIFWLPYSPQNSVFYFLFYKNEPPICPCSLSLQMPKFVTLAWSGVVFVGGKLRHDFRTRGAWWACPIGQLTTVERTGEIDPNSVSARRKTVRPSVICVKRLTLWTSTSTWGWISGEIQKISFCRDLRPRAGSRWKPW